MQHDVEASSDLFQDEQFIIAFWSQAITNPNHIVDFDHIDGGKTSIRVKDKRFAWYHNEDELFSTTQVPWKVSHNYYSVVFIFYKSHHSVDVYVDGKRNKLLEKSNHSFT